MRGKISLVVGLAFIAVFCLCSVTQATPPPVANSAAPGNTTTLLPDITVAADGSGDFKTIQEAVASIPKDNHERKIILIKPGVYQEKVRIDASNVTLAEKTDMQAAWNTRN